MSLHTFEQADRKPYPVAASSKSTGATTDHEILEHLRLGAAKSAPHTLDRHRNSEPQNMLKIVAAI